MTTHHRLGIGANAATEVFAGIFLPERKRLAKRSVDHRMRKSALALLFAIPCLLMACATAQKTAVGEGASHKASATEATTVAAPVSASGKPLPTLKALEVYLRKIDGRWTVSLEGSVTDADTEYVEVSLTDKPHSVVGGLPAGQRKTGCMAKKNDRAKFGYSECNSAFYSVNVGTSATRNLIRGALSLGILTVADAATGGTDYSVSFDQKALDDAVAEANAVEFARQVAPLVRYRRAYQRVYKARHLQDFIDRYKGVYDPDSLIAEAEAKLPFAIEQERIIARQQIEEEAAKAAVEAKQRAAIRQQEEMAQENLRKWRAQLKPGDKVTAKFEDYILSRNPPTGMIIEVKAPLAYVQWDILEPAVRWYRLDALFPK